MGVCLRPCAATGVQCESCIWLCTCGCAYVHVRCTCIYVCRDGWVCVYRWVSVCACKSPFVSECTRVPVWVGVCFVLRVFSFPRLCLSAWKLGLHERNTVFSVCPCVVHRMRVPHKGWCPGPAPRVGTQRRADVPSLLAATCPSHGSAARCLPREPASGSPVSAQLVKTSAPHTARCTHGTRCSRHSSLDPAGRPRCRRRASGPLALPSPPGTQLPPSRGAPHTHTWLLPVTRPLPRSLGTPVQWPYLFTTLARTPASARQPTGAGVPGLTPRLLRVRGNLLAPDCWLAPQRQDRRAPDRPPSWSAARRRL